MKKKVIALIAVAALSVSALTGCGSKGADDKTIKVAATAVPHAEILEAAKPLLEKQGYTLEVQVFDDYVQPNEVVESGEFDANYFQHIPYLESFNEEKGTHLVNAGGIHYEPFGLYPGRPAWTTLTMQPSQYPTIPPTRHVPCYCYRITVTSP